MEACKLIWDMLSWPSRLQFARLLQLTLRHFSSALWNLLKVLGDGKTDVHHHGLGSDRELVLPACAPYVRSAHADVRV